jgi:hypothetical protein
MRSLLLNTERWELDALDALIDTKSKKPIKVEKSLLRRLVMDHRKLVTIAGEVVAITEPKE